MTDVFISYAREDRAQAGELAQLLEQHGYTVWWDWDLVGGTRYREIIGNKIKEARKVIVLWSAHSIDSAFVIDEAQEAKDANKLIPIAIDSSRPPMGFRDVHTLNVNKFQAVADAILAAIEDRRSVQGFLARPKLAPRAIYAMVAVACLALGTALGVYVLNRPNPSVEPVYSFYKSAELGVTLVFPNNIFSLDTTERLERRLSLRDGHGHPQIRITRTALPEHRDIKLGRQNEVNELKKLNYTLTYIAPERDANWKDWYIVSGVANDTKIYYRRWYCDDSVVSMEFVYPRELAPLFDKLIPTMTTEFAYSATSPKLVP